MYETKGLTYYNFVAKYQLSQNKIVARVMNLIDTIYIDRESIRQTLGAYETQHQAINDGRSIALFVEGTRIYGDEFGEFKPAALKLAYKCMIPIVPIVIYGSSGLLDRNKTNRNKNKRIYVKVLPILKPHDFITSSEPFIAEQLKQHMQRAYNDMKQLADAKKPVLSGK
jgi:1-acyl-sn-glycerol-3-phosphate acyltransferase